MAFKPADMERAFSAYRACPKTAEHPIELGSDIPPVACDGWGHPVHGYLEFLPAFPSPSSKPRFANFTKPKRFICMLAVVFTVKPGYHS